MAVYKCGLCAYRYEEDEEQVTWAELPGNWTCPVCGSPLSSFTEVTSKPVAAPVATAAVSLSLYECGLCAFGYDESKEETAWSDLAGEWTCPVCGSGKGSFAVKSGGEAKPAASDGGAASVGEGYLSEWQRPGDEFEEHMADIHQMAVAGKSVGEPMRTRVPVFSWDEILFKGAQLFRLPLNKTQPVSCRTVIGPGAKSPMVLETPVFVTHMSYGALSKEAKVAMAKGSAMAGTAMGSGEGGILPDALAASHRYIFEYVPNKYSVTDENLARVDAVEIKIGQSAKPGMGGHLPGDKVTREIATVRGKREGMDITSPACFPDIRTPEELKATVARLREKTGGKPVGIKLAAGHIEEDMKIAVAAGADFITLDGRAGGTGSAPKVVKGSASVPTIFALARARKVLDALGAGQVSLVITGGFRVSSDIAKALALGADAVALGTGVMMALGCQQYRVCNTGRCPVGIATQDPALRARLDVDQSAARVANYFSVITEELKDFSRLTGHPDVHGLSIRDICTTNSEISNHTPVQHV